MNSFKSHFALSKGQQNGIFVLILLIILLQLVIIGMNYLPKDDSNSLSNEEVEEWTRQLDSLNRPVESRKDTIYPFNPNFINDYKAYQLGMNLKETDRLLEYRKAGNWINSTEDFQKVTGVSDSLLNILSASFRFPEWVNRNQVTSVTTKQPSRIVEKTDLNSARVEDLKLVNGVGEVLSARIVKYRNSLGGFLDEAQLQDVYGLTPEVIQKIREKFEIRTRPDIRIKNINSISLSELSEIPYFNYQMAKKIITYRSLNEGIRSFEELSEIPGFPYDKIDRIKLYLTIN